MRDIPAFTSEYGIASLTLSQIPYTKAAYIRIQHAVLPDALLRECIAFCRAAGAETVYATGHSVCQSYPEHTAIIKMRADVNCVGETDAALFPVTEKTLEQWRTIYNEKICRVPNGAWKTISQAQELLNAGDGYFIHRDNTLLGIGKASGDQLHWVASVESGAGEDVVRALCHALTGDTVTLEVASANTKAIQLYEKLGFVRTSLISVWYHVFS